MKIISRIMALVLAGMAAVLPSAAQAVGPTGQVIDTSGIYRDRSDSLAATVFVVRQEGNYLSKGKQIRTEVISSAGLNKMACCSLAESFECVFRSIATQGFQS